MAARLAGLTWMALALASAPACAQDTETQEPAAEEATARRDRATVLEEGRGLQYGAHLVSPIYLTDVRRFGGGVTAPIVNPGAGIEVRLGWELPAGFAVELQAVLAFNYVDYAPDTLARSLDRVDVRAAGRYGFLNDSPVIPYVEIGAGLRMLTLEFDDMAEQPAPGFTFAMHGGAGVRIDATSFLGIELGVMVDYIFALADVFHEPGIVGLTPFAGVTLYAFDPDDPI